MVSKNMLSHRDRLTFRYANTCSTNLVQTRALTHRLWVGMLLLAIASSATEVTAQRLTPSETQGHPDVLVSKSATHWTTYDNCPVLIDHAVDIPALESGLLKEVYVRLNEPVGQNGKLAQLDSELAELEVQVAQLQYDSATKLAEDRADVDFQLMTLQELQDELASYRRIKDSVSDGEIRNLTLRVGKAQLTLTQARHAHARNGLSAQLQQASLRSAQQRLARRTVLSPIAGIATRVDKKAGQWVEAGEVIARVEDFSRLQVDALVPERDIDRSEIVGSQVRTTVDTADGPILLQGTVSSYDPKVSSSGLIRIHCEVSNVLHRGHYVLLPGMTVGLQIRTHL